MRISELTDDQLKEKVKKGHDWLKKNKDHVRYEKNLSYYNLLLDVYEKRGFNKMILLDDEEILKKERGDRHLLLQTDSHTSLYHDVYEEWWRLRDEGVFRKLFPFFIPSRNDRLES